MKYPLIINCSDGENIILPHEKIEDFPYITENIDLISLETCIFRNKEIAVKCINLPFSSTTFNNLLSLFCEDGIDVSKDIYLLSEYLQVNTYSYIGDGSKFARDLMEYLYEHKNQNKDFYLYFNLMCSDIQKKYLLSVANDTAPFHDKFYVFISNESNGVDDNIFYHYTDTYQYIESVDDDIKTSTSRVYAKSKNKKTKKDDDDDDDDDVKPYRVYAKSKNEKIDDYIYINAYYERKSNGDGISFKKSDIMNAEDGHNNIININRNSLLDDDNDKEKPDMKCIIKRIGNTIVLLLVNERPYSLAINITNTMKFATFSLDELRNTDSINVKLIPMSDIQLIWRNDCSVNSASLKNICSNADKIVSSVLFAFKKNEN